MNDSARDEALKKIEALFASQKLAVLSTCGKNGPYANLIAFAATEDLQGILFATPEKTLKYENMTLDRRVALLVENSRNSEDDFQKALSVTAIGRVDVLKGPISLLARAKYLSKHSNLQGFVDSPNCALMQVAVEAYVLVESLGKATRIPMKG